VTEFEAALSDVCSSWQALQPPNRMTVADGAAKNFIVTRPGGGSGPWNPHETPYMVEPLNTWASRVHSGMVFVGPAQTGKTAALGEGALAHFVANDPGDMLIVQMTQDKAREYSKQRIDRMIRNSPLLKRFIARSQDDNTHDKLFVNGMWLRIAWPTATNLSSTSYRYVYGTDYDRWPENIDGEGDGWTLMGKRITTFLSRGMACVESSPGFDIADPNYRLSTPHEAPPVGGVLGVYNRSDRRRWYWGCPHCRESFEAKPGLGLFGLPPEEQLLEDVRNLDIDRFAKQYARVPCPICEAIIPRQEREGMNQRGVWLPDGVRRDALGRLSGTPRTSSIAGFYLGGVAATYVSWETLIRKHMQALLDFALTNDELSLKTTANTDQSLPYTPRHLVEAARGAQRPADRAIPDMPRFVAPDWTRFVVASVDIQGGARARFVVQVHAVGEHLQQALIDRYAITDSEREGPDGLPAPIDPAAHPEDWDLLTKHVVRATYRTSREGREIRVYAVGVDSGGEAGVTDKAYAWYRRLRLIGEHHRVRLFKGMETKVDWHVRETMVGSKQGQGDIPLQLLNSNLFKDMVSNGLAVREPGPGYYHFPLPRGPKNPGGWLMSSFFDELQAEIRNPDGTWTQVKARNESFDLCCYNRALCMILGCDRRGFWAAPPAWALPLDENSEVMDAQARRDMKAEPTVPRERQVRRSGYLSG
jgi:phage terminase large subunit GpA-like protein